MKQRADHSRRHVDFEVGQKVWLSTSHLPLRDGARKLAARWTGPYAITAAISPAAFQLALPSHWNVHNVFHSSQLKPCIGSIRRPEPLAVES